MDKEIHFSLFFITKDIEVAVVVISPWFSVKNSNRQLNFCRWNGDSTCKCTLLDFCYNINTVLTIIKQGFLCQKK